MTVPGVSLSVTDHNGLEAVNCEAESGTALAGFQVPSEAMLPAILMFCPTTVVTSSLKVIATLVGQVPDGVVVLGGEVTVFR